MDKKLLTQKEKLLTFLQSIHPSTLDQEPHYRESLDLLDWDAIKQTLRHLGKKNTKKEAKALGIITRRFEKLWPTNAGMILFARNRECNALIRCARFEGVDQMAILESVDLESHPAKAIEEAIRFIHKHIGSTTYPEGALREIIINAIVHARYSFYARGCILKILIFDDRIRFVGEGGICASKPIDYVLGFTLIRNTVITNIFKELGLIKLSGSGLQYIIASCEEHGLPKPNFDIDSLFFCTTLYCKKSKLKKEI